MPRDRFTLEEALNFNIVEDVVVGDADAPVWADVDAFSVNAGESVRVPFKNYVSGADTYYVADGETFENGAANADGELVYTAPADAQSGTEIKHTIRAVDSATRIYTDKTLIITVN